MNIDGKIFTVEKLAHGGEGIVRDGSHTIFVPYVIPGEKITIEVVKGSKSPTRARVTQLVEPSPYRVEPYCPLFGTCGGCDLQHMAYGKQVEHKRHILIEALERIGGVSPMVWETVPSPNEYNYRSRIKLHVIDGASGYYAAKREDFIEVEQCMLAEDAINAAIPRLPGLIRLTDARTIELFRIDDGRISAVVRTDAGRPRFILDGDSWSKDDGVSAAFRQVNPRQNDNLRKIVSGIVASIGPKGVIELFAGGGNLTEVVAPHCGWIVAVDSDPEAVAHGRAKLGDRVSFELSSAAGFMNSALGNKLAPDLVLLDPPRVGAKESMKRLIEMAPRHVVYVSCEPATLARDVKTLVEGGYEVEHIAPVDMFPQTAHIESVSLLVRRA